MKTSERIEGLKDQLKPCLAQYLEERGIPTSTGKIRCITGSHTDAHPSMSLFADGTRVFCFACRYSGDLFDVAHLLEGYPVEGGEFLKDNVFRLARRFGIAIPEGVDDLTEEELLEQNILRAYEHASRILVTSDRSELAEKYIAERGWNKTTLSGLGIGSVSSFSDYCDRMTKQYGFDPELLRRMDLLNRNIFSPDRVVFTVKDETGGTVGFAARNVRYLTDGSAGEKYYNTSGGRLEGETQVANHLYQKGKRLFGLSRARRHAPPLYIFEGYADAATAVDRKLHNSCAIGGTAFTSGHLDLLFQQKINHLIFCLDADSAGAAATERFVELVDKSMGNHPKIRVEILTMPAGSDDPDSYIRAQGMDSFLRLEKTDVFRWRLEKSIERGEDPHLVAQAMIPLIINEPSNIERDRKIKDTAKATSVSRDFIQKEVLSLLDEAKVQAEEARTSIALKFSKKLQQNPTRISAIFLEGQKELEVLDGRMGSYEPKDFVAEVHSSRKTARELKDEMGLKTGWPLFDKHMHGIPQRDAMIIVPGKSHHGKTSLFADLSVRITAHNDNSIVLVHTMDDALSMFLYKVLAAKSGVLIDVFRYEGAQANLTDGMRDAMNTAYRWVEEKANDGRLIIAGASQIPPSLAAAANWIRRTRKAMPEAEIVYIADNFHIFTDGNEDNSSGNDAVRQRENSRFMKNLANTTQSTIIASMELTKKDFGPGIRPKMGSPRGSGGMTYDANICWNVYNELMDIEDEAQLIWRDLDNPNLQHHGSGEILTPDVKPVVEINIDKNKVDGRRGRFYFNFDPFTSRFHEVSPQQREEFLAMDVDNHDHGNKWGKRAA